MTRKQTRIDHKDPSVRPYVEIISRLGGTTQDGASWDEIVDMVDEEKLSRDLLENTIDDLLDQGDLYQPLL